MLASFVLLAACNWSFAEAATLQEGANPIRRIVTLLQDMAKEIEAEAVKEQAAFDKFMCYCDGNADGMAKSVEAGKQASAELSSKFEALKAEKAQLDQELKEHQATREAAKHDQDKATSIREQEHSDFEASSADAKSNIAAMTKAVAALEKGAGAFVQMGSEQLARVQRVVATSDSVDDLERQGVLDFLQGKQSQDYAPQSGQITGILKAMNDEMQKDLKDSTAAEKAAAAGFEELSAAKASEVEAATAAIESKTKRSGELAVEIVQTADDVEDTDKEVADTQAFLADLDTQCASKKGEWAERKQTRAEEVAAIGQAIAVLNDDDALDLFKKTAPSLTQTSSGVFLQKSSKLSVGLRARGLVLSLAQTSRSHQTQLNLIASALRSKAVDFSKITAMIDEMVSTLGQEQKDDEEQKAFCEAELSKSEQEKADATDKLASLQASIEEMSATVATLTDEIATLQAEIKALDKAVAEATEQRKAEHEAFLQAQAENQAATQLVEKAKNKLNKFYRPNLYKEEPTRELTAEEKILASSGRSDMIATDAPARISAGSNDYGTVYVQVRDNAVGAPPPPPETFGAYQKKDGKSNGVMALMDMMINDLKKDHSESEHAEEMGQKDYENLMAASQKTREQSAASITEKESSKADLSEKVEQGKAEATLTQEELQAIGQKIADLHASCDFLVQNFDARKEARTNEVEGLKNAKAVLSGANM